jgi:hypothetical protein
MKLKPFGGTPDKKLGQKIEISFKSDGFLQNVLKDF